MQVGDDGAQLGGRAFGLSIALSIVSSLASGSVVFRAAASRVLNLCIVSSCSTRAHRARSTSSAAGVPRRRLFSTL